MTAAPAKIIRTVLPTTDGEWTPAEAMDWTRINTPTENLAGDKEMAGRVKRYVETIHSEWTDRTRQLHRRWRAVLYMLAGNTLERSLPVDIHVPEIYKAIETMVPRLEEPIIDSDPIFRLWPRRLADRRKIETNAAYYDWLLDQARFRDLVQPILRNMLITQCTPVHVRWENRINKHLMREVRNHFDADGKMRREVRTQWKDVVDYAGPVYELVDPFDYIIHTKAKTAQDAIYVGHRSWMTRDEIQRVGKQLGWQNLSDLDRPTGNTALDTETDQYRWPRDPTALIGKAQDRNGIGGKDERPDSLEVIQVYSRWSLNEGKSYSDYRMTFIGGRITAEVRENPYSGGLRPYAEFHDCRSGYEYYGIGTFDNAVRMNQHLDRLHQGYLRTAELAGGPLVFAEEDCDIPDSLYRCRPLQVFKGVGPIRFSQVPDGALGAAPMVIGMLQRNIEETIGNFRLNMGQDSNGTATEASLSLQEGNRRNRSHIRAFSTGMEQLLTVTHALARQFSSHDVEIPVLGKRALSLRADRLTMSPADLLDEVRFEIVGLKSARTYGMRQTGLMALSNSAAPFIAANPDLIDQTYLVHSMASELLGPEEADRIVRLPTQSDMLASQDEESEALMMGEAIEVDRDDDHRAHARSMLRAGIVQRALDKDSEMPVSVRIAVLEHYENHVLRIKREEAQAQSRSKRQPTLPIATDPSAMPELSGQRPDQAPPPGGMSNAMASLAGPGAGGGPGGQVQGQNPGPAAAGKYGRGTRRGRTVNQTEDEIA